MQTEIHIHSFSNMSVTLLCLRKHTLSGVMKRRRRLCRRADIGDYSSLLCQIYRPREHGVDWICDHCHAGCLLVAHLYSCRCLDDLLIKYTSPAALRMRVAVEMEFFSCQEWSFACQEIMLGVTWGRKSNIPFLRLNFHNTYLLCCNNTSLHWRQC